MAGQRAVRVLVLWADDDSSNLGVRALAEGTGRMVWRAFPDAQVTFQSYGAGSAPRPFGARSLGLAIIGLSPALTRWFATFDLVIDTGAGDSFADIYGIRRLLEMTAARALAHRQGVPVVFGPQTIGPFETRAGRALARYSLRRANAIFARDNFSVTYASTELGRHAIRTSDVVFELDHPPASPAHDIVLNASGLLWRENTHVNADRYRRQTLELIEALCKQGRDVSLLSHVLASDNADSDEVAITDILRRFPSVRVVRPKTLTEARVTIASSTAVVGARMHACLNALSQGIPAVPWAYSRKFAPLLEAVGWDTVVDLRTEPDAVAPTLSALQQFRSGEVSASKIPATARALNEPAIRALRRVLAND